MSVISNRGPGTGKDYSRPKYEKRGYGTGDSSTRSHRGPRSSPKTVRITPGMYKAGSFEGKYGLGGRRYPQPSGPKARPLRRNVVHG